MRATLLQDNPAFAVMLPCAFAEVDVDVDTVDSVDGVRRAMRRADPDDFVIVDCSLDRPGVRARCVEVSPLRIIPWCAR